MTEDIYKYTFIHTVLVPTTGMNTECILVIDYTIVDVLVVHTWTLYYTYNNSN